MSGFPEMTLTEIEFVFIDDGSQDRTYDLLTETSKADLRVKVVRFSRNFGHQAALLAGYSWLKGMYLFHWMLICRTLQN